MAKRKKSKPEWIKETLDLKADHRWQSKPGCKVFVAARGAVRFDVPQDWVFEPDVKSFKFLDREPPNDDCRLEMSFNLLPEGDWSLFPLKATLKKIVADDERHAIATSDVFTLKRQTARIVWAEIKFIDPEEHREAFSCICIGLGSNVQCLLTFEYWADQADRRTPVWDNVLDSLTLGLYIRDPLSGLAFQIELTIHRDIIYNVPVDGSNLSETLPAHLWEASCLTMAVQSLQRRSRLTPATSSSNNASKRGSLPLTVTGNLMSCCCERN